MKRRHRGAPPSSQNPETSSASADAGHNATSNAAHSRSGAIDLEHAADHADNPARRASTVVRRDRRGQLSNSLHTVRVSQSGSSSESADSRAGSPSASSAAWLASVSATHATR